MKARRRTVEATPSLRMADIRTAIIPGAASVSISAGGSSQAIGILWRETPFGGRRAYFACPRCSEGAEILYLSGFLACRKCHGLAYRIENLTKLWRKNEKLLKLQRRAGIDTSRLPRPIPPKPKWQRWHTYLKTRQAIHVANRDFWRAWPAAWRPRSK